jgi:hypothetical protein
MQARCSATGQERTHTICNTCFESGFMKPSIRFTKIWADEDMLELRVEISDGRSLFMNQIYVGHKLLADTVLGLHQFKDQVHGGLFNLRFGEFGPEYASGALDIRMHFRKRGKLLVQISAQSEFSRFDDRELSSNARLHLLSEPALLDSFILGLRALSEGSTGQAELEAIDWS